MKQLREGIRWKCRNTCDSNGGLEVKVRQSLFLKRALLTVPIIILEKLGMTIALLDALTLFLQHIRATITPLWKTLHLNGGGTGNRRIRRCYVAIILPLKWTSVPV